MRIEKIGGRNLMVQFSLPDWDLNLHIIQGDKYNFIIDTGLGAETALCIREILAGSGKEMIVINTHHHWDHIWGNASFSSNAIIAHTLCRTAMMERWDAMQAKYGHFAMGKAECCLPSLVFDNALHFPDEDISIFYSPGHTADAISVYDRRDKILNAGDNIGDTMEEPVPSLEMAVAIYVQTLRSYQALGPFVCTSGHNSPQGPEIFDKIIASLGSV